jgi:cytochrome c biogenesis protein CcdA
VNVVGWWVQVGSSGSLGAFLPLVASGIAILMGLNLLELVKLQLPSFESSTNFDGIPPSMQAFLLGESTCTMARPTFHPSDRRQWVCSPS